MTTINNEPTAATTKFRAIRLYEPDDSNSHGLWMAVSEDKNGRVLIATDKTEELTLARLGRALAEADRPVQQTRKNNPRIGQIEAEIDQLTHELVGQIGITDKDRQNVYEDLEEVGWQGTDDLMVVRGKLDMLEDCDDRDND